MTYPCTQCILDHIASSGPQDVSDLRRECRIQAVPYTQELFDAALLELVSAGKIVADVGGEDTNPYVWYDFPDSFYLP